MAEQVCLPKRRFGPYIMQIQGTVEGREKAGEHVYV